MSETNCKCGCSYEIGSGRDCVHVHGGGVSVAAEPEACGNCRYWFKLCDSNSERPNGYCRAHPPRPDDEKIYLDWWCGEWKAK